LEYNSLSRLSNINTIIVLHSGKIAFIDDSLKPILAVKEDISKIDADQEKIYTWRQNNTDIIVSLILKNQELTISDLKVDIWDDKIFVSIQKPTQIILLNGELHGLIDSVNSKFEIIDGNRLEIKLVKIDKFSWTEVLKGDTNGKYIPDSDILKMASESLMEFTSEKEVTETFNSRPVFNAESIEDCDIVSTESLSLSWLEFETHQVARSVDFGGHQFLFASRISTEEPPNICLRYDVDGLLYRIPSDPLQKRSNEFESAHWATFNAFGYVEAAKESRRIVSCSPSAKYAVIVDQRRNVYVYWREVESELRNRHSGEKSLKISRQSLLTVDSGQHILGLIVLDNYIFVLTDMALYAFTLLLAQ